MEALVCGEPVGDECGESTHGAVTLPDGGHIAQVGGGDVGGNSWVARAGMYGWRRWEKAISSSLVATKLFHHPKIDDHTCS